VTAAVGAWGVTATVHLWGQAAVGSAAWAAQLEAALAAGVASVARLAVASERAVEVSVRVSPTSSRVAAVTVSGLADEPAALAVKGALVAGARRLLDELAFGSYIVTSVQAVQATPHRTATPLNDSKAALVVESSAPFSAAPTLPPNDRATAEKGAVEVRRTEPPNHREAEQEAVATTVSSEAAAGPWLERRGLAPLEPLREEPLDRGLEGRGAQAGDWAPSPPLSPPSTGFAADDGSEDSAKTEEEEDAWAARVHESVEVDDWSIAVSPLVPRERPPAPPLGVCATDFRDEKRAEHRPSVSSLAASQTGPLLRPSDAKGDQSEGGTNAEASSEASSEASASSSSSSSSASSSASASEREAVQLQVGRALLRVQDLVREADDVMNDHELDRHE
jgi:hypothetical protein